LGTVYLDRKQPREAVKYYLKCLLLTRTIQDSKREKTILNNLVLACMSAEDYDLALEYSLEQLQITANEKNRLKISSRISALRVKVKQSLE